MKNLPSYLIARPITLWNEIPFKILMFLRSKKELLFLPRWYVWAGKFKLITYATLWAVLRYNALLCVLLKMLKKNSEWPLPMFRMQMFFFYSTSLLFTEMNSNFSVVNNKQYLTMLRDNLTKLCFVVRSYDTIK